MKFTPALFAAVACAVASARIHAQTPRWGGDAFGDFSDRGGVILDNTFVFEPGSFFGGSVPSASNIDPWILNRFDQEGSNDVVGYFTSTDYGLHDFTGTIPTASSLSLAGLDACLWTRNDENPDEGSEWLLTRATNWNYPRVSSACREPDPVAWSVSDPVSGNVLEWVMQNDGPDSEEFPGSASTGLQTFSFVPEPSSPFLSAVAGGFLVLRRRRSAS